MDMFVGAEVVVIGVRTNVVADSLIEVGTDNLADVFINVCADMLVKADVSEVDIIVVTSPLIALEFIMPV